MGKIRTVIIGYGYWGPNLVRNISLNPDYELVAIVDNDIQRLKDAKENYDVEVYSNYEEIAGIELVDLVIICTRPSTHLEIAVYFMDKVKYMLITKPCGTSKAEAIQITELSRKMGVKVFCDFTYHYSATINFLLKNPITAEIIQTSTEYTSYRTSLGIIQADVDVLADLAVHDIYILLMLKGELPQAVSCLRTNPAKDSQLRGAFLILMWENDFTASIHVNWLSPRKNRLISIVGPSAAIIIEEMNSKMPVQIINFSPSVFNYEEMPLEDRKKLNVSYSMGEIIAPRVESGEALEKEFQSLAAAIRGTSSLEKYPDSSDAIAVWQVVEALRRSISSDGKTQIV